MEQLNEEVVYTNQKFMYKRDNSNDLPADLYSNNSLFDNSLLSNIDNTTLNERNQFYMKKMRAIRQASYKKILEGNSLLIF